MKLLCTADLHLGRRPARLPEKLAKKYSTAHTWLELVETAIQLQVDGVLLAGDVVDQENQYFEAFGPLEEGIKRLAAAEIPVIAVAGNHDALVLARLAARVNDDFFQHLGGDGNWENYRLKSRNSSECIQVVGWSFTGEAASSASCWGSFEGMELDRNRPTLGLLHGDLQGNPEGKYNPIAWDQLRAHPLDGWVLGHIHKPTPLTPQPSPLVFYPGSPQGISPGVGEQGIHGPVLLTFEAATGFRAERLPLARLRYQPLTVLLDDPGTTQDAIDQVHDAIREAIRGWQAETPKLELTVIRLAVAGTCAIPPSELQQALEMLVREQADSEHSRFLIDGISIETQPVLAVDRLAQEAGIIGQLARLIQELDQPADSSLASGTQELLRQADGQLLELTARQKSFKLLEVDSPDVLLADISSEGAGISKQGVETGREGAAMTMQRTMAAEARRLLAELVCQQEAAHG